MWGKTWIILENVLKSLWLIKNKNAAERDGPAPPRRPTLPTQTKPRESRRRRFLTINQVWIGTSRDPVGASLASWNHLAPWTCRGKGHLSASITPDTLQRFSGAAWLRKTTSSPKEKGGFQFSASEAASVLGGFFIRINGAEESLTHESKAFAFHWSEKPGRKKWTTRFKGSNLGSFREEKERNLSAEGVKGHNQP